LTKEYEKTYGQIGSKGGLADERGLREHHHHKKEGNAIQQVASLAAFKQRAKAAKERADVAIEAKRTDEQKQKAPSNRWPARGPEAEVVGLASERYETVASSGFNNYSQTGQNQRIHDSRIGAEYTITLDKSTGAALGIDVEPLDESPLQVEYVEALQIENIKEGLVSSWNRRNPGNEVHLGDHFLEVNGVSGAANMAAELGQDRMLTILCVYGGGQRVNGDMDESNEVEDELEGAERPEAMEKYKKVVDQKVNAATKIQSAHRGRTSRKLVSDMKRAKADHSDNPKRVESAESSHKLEKQNSGHRKAKPKAKTKAKSPGTPKAANSAATPQFVCPTEAPQAAWTESTQFG